MNPKGNIFHRAARFTGVPCRNATGRAAAAKILRCAMRLLRKKFLKKSHVICCIKVICSKVICSHIVEPCNALRCI